MGDPDTVDKRTGLFVLMTALGVLLGIGAVPPDLGLAPAVRVPPGPSASRPS
ncbi:hypothetical protein [Streptomyces sp. NPDC058307]|uniref:hypothetical protein n=1 Tax=Streptomyces sp. NPDC058307 TaxID=3346439 RepID=UPI0036EB7A96